MHLALEVNFMALSGLLTMIVSFALENETNDSYTA